MSLSEIDVIQTAQIEDLQDDVKELRDKLNILVSDITDVDGVDGATRDGLTKKLNDAIDDADNLNTIINAGYSVGTGGGSSTVGILKRLDELFQDLEDHSYLPTAESAPGGSTYKETHPPDNLSSPVWQTGGTSVSNISGTAQGSATRTHHTSVSEVIDQPDPVYVPEPLAVMTLKNKSERRARKLSRGIAKKVKKQWARRKKRTYN